MSRLKSSERICLKSISCLWLFFCVPALFAAPAPTPVDKPFEFYPRSNGDKPVTYTKTPVSWQQDGKNWDFKYGAKVVVTIDAGQVIRNVTPYQFGNNLCWYDGREWLSDSDRSDKAQQAGISFWRFPGGSSSDLYNWDGIYDQAAPDQTNPGHMNESWASSTDNYIQFCENTNSEGIITVNYGASRYASVKYAADLASRWVGYFKQKGFKIRYWEIGNELYGPWEESNTLAGKPQLTGDVYGADFQVIAQAMRQADPDIFIGAVTYEKDGPGEWDGHHNWTRKLFSTLGGKADFLILHQYFLYPFKNGDSNQYADPSNETLFGNLHELGDDLASMRKMAAETAPGQENLPVALTEFNILNASPTQTIQLINGLFTAEALGEAIKVGYAAANYWDWKNGIDTKLNGDMGMLALRDNNTKDDTPRPSYYAYALYNKAFGDKMVASSSSDPVFKVYASRFSTGEMGLILVNESADNRWAVFNIKGFQPKGKLMGWVLTAKGLNDTQVSWNGVPGTVGGGGPFPLDSIKPYRGEFKTDRVLQLPLAAHSATGIILY